MWNFRHTPLPGGICVLGCVWHVRLWRNQIFYPKNLKGLFRVNVIGIWKLSEWGHLSDCDFSNCLSVKLKSGKRCICSRDIPCLLPILYMWKYCHKDNGLQLLYLFGPYFSLKSHSPLSHRLSQTKVIGKYCVRKMNWVIFLLYPIMILIP